MEGACRRLERVSCRERGVRRRRFEVLETGKVNFLRLVCGRCGLKAVKAAESDKAGW